MFDGIMESYGSRFIIAAGGVAIALLLLVAVLWIMRNRASSPFVRGGRNRQPRLQVLDAAAVDARRRLVLVRRDDVEHLILIGGRPMSSSKAASCRMGRSRSHANRLAPKHRSRQPPARHPPSQL